MTASLEPGYVLDDRYRLEERAGEHGCAELWRGTDTILARTVTVMVLPAAAHETPRALTAARRASRIRDPRVVQVFDTATLDGLTYVVTEWVTGRSLTELLLESGPLHPERAGALVGEAAEALAAAHRVAVSHLALTPDNLVWTPTGVKVTGVGLAAALTGAVSDDPARTDAEGLGALLYAALTGRWPYGPYGGLPAAPPMAGASHYSPRQARAGVPPELDATAERALCQRPRRGQPALTTPAAVAGALAEYPDPMPLDLFAEVTPGAEQPVVEEPATGPLVATTYGAAPPRREHRARRALVAVPAGLVVVALLAFGGVRLGMSGLNNVASPQTSSSASARSSPSDSASGSSPSAQETSPEPTLVGKQQYPVVAGHDFDPLGDGEEHASDVDKAFDGTARSSWETDTYTTADLGNLKSGVGVVFDLGSPKQVAAVELRLEGDGADLQLRTADDFADALTGYDKVASVDDTGEKVTVQPDEQSPKRYWLVWITKLPDVGDGYRAGIADITFHPTG